MHKYDCSFAAHYSNIQNFVLVLFSAIYIPNETY